MELKLVNKLDGNVILTDKKHSISKEFKERMFSGEIEDIKDCDESNRWNATEEMLYLTNYDEYDIKYLKKVKMFLKWLEEDERTAEAICEEFNSQFSKSHWSGREQTLKPFDEIDYKYYRIKK